jgi:tetratricopeptide (TPR) repeat protein
LVADWLITQGDERVGEHSGLIAGHMLQAGRRDEAGQYFLRAGQVALLTYANGEAESNFRKALNLLPASSQHAPCLAGTSEALSRQGRREEAAPLLHQAIELYAEMGDHDWVARLYTRLARILWYDDNEKSWQACKEGLARLDGTPERPGLALLLAEAGRIAYFQNQPSEEVVSLCQRAIAMADRFGKLEARAEASITIALSYQYTAPDRGVKILQEVIPLIEANELWEQAARAYSVLGSIFYYIPDLELAQKNTLKAVEISSRIVNTDAFFHALSNLGIELIELGRLNSFETDLVEILHQSSASPAQAEEFLDSFRSWLFYYRGEWTRAAEIYREVLKSGRVKSNFQLKELYNGLLATTNLELNRFMGLSDTAESEASLRESIDMDWSPLKSRYSLVGLLSRQGRFIEAHALLAEAVSSIVQPETRSDLVVRLAAEIELALAERRFSEAIDVCYILIHIYQAGGCRWQHARRLIDLGEALAGRCEPGDLEQARATYQQALDMFTKMGAPGYVQVLEQRLGSKAL